MRAVLDKKRQQNKLLQWEIKQRLVQEQFEGHHDYLPPGQISGASRPWQAEHGNFKIHASALTHEALKQNKENYRESDKGGPFFLVRQIFPQNVLGEAVC